MMKDHICYSLIGLFLMTLSTKSVAQQDTIPFVNLSEKGGEAFVFDMRYATADNFLKQQVYDCADCVIREEVADCLMEANQYFISKGYRIKFFDCYRPLDVQQKMWDVFPDGRYVANPKKGSIHNRGGAVDISLVKVSGEALDMGTEFDHFGKEAHHDYPDLSTEVLNNRALLKEGMMRFGFSPLATEWWHYNYGSSKKYAVSNFKTECKD